MAASVVKSGFGTQFKRGTTAVAEITNIKGPGLSRDPIDVTHHTSPSGWREFIGGLVDGGEVTMDLNFLPGNSTQSALITDMGSSTAVAYSVVFIDAPTTYSFNGLVQTFEPEAPIDSQLKASVKVKVSGVVTIT